METAKERAVRLGLLHPGERLDDLMRDGLHILQRPEGYRFGMDSVLLAAFASQRNPAVRLAADLGAGSGILPLLVCARLPGVRFDAIEIQPDIADMAARSVQICGLSERISVHTVDLRDAAAHLGYERYPLVLSNPPYGKRGWPPNPDLGRRIARHEGEADIDDICKSAFRLLQNGGRFAVCFPSSRFLELVDSMRAARLEPKRIRLVHPSPGKAPNLALVEAVKSAKQMLHFLPPLFVRDAHGHETDELARQYGTRHPSES